MEYHVATLSTGRAKRWEEKIARKVAKADLKRKLKDEKRRQKMEALAVISPTKREKIEKMAEKQVEEILQAAQVMPLPKDDKEEEKDQAKIIA